MRIRTWLRYLIGDRQAILEIAQDRRALGLGLLFVLSAGLAREYDGEDLLQEPWHVVLPVAASLVTSFLLFCLTYAPAKEGEEPRPSFLRAYGMFLGVFWMTAPLAWLYGIPYERFLPALGATRANLITLGIVSVWRVVLMMRVVSVLMAYHWAIAALLVLAL